MKQASPPHTYTVGIAAPAGDDLLVQMIAEGLRTHGMCRVVSLIQDSGTPPTLAQRILLAGDRALSRWLPGSSLPCPDPEASISPPETATPSSTLDGVIVVGALAVETDGLAPGASTYRLELGDQREDFPPIPGATEVLCRCGTVRMRLRHLSGERASFRGGEMAVQTHRYSIHRTRSTVLASLPTFLENALLPSDPSLCQTSASEEERAAGPPERIGWRAMARHLGGLVSALIERLLFRFQWILAVAPAPTPGQPVNWSLLRPVPQPADRLWADPFLVRRDGRLWLFFEDAPFQSRKGIDIGHISVAPIEPGGLLGPVRSALDMETHLSYPNVFEFNGEWYMLPETGSLGKLELYHCVGWPDRWAWHSTLIDDYQGYDPTIIETEIKYWMFAARRAKGVGTTDFLDLFSAPSPLGPWVRHPSSPVVQDVRRARPGGRFFVHDGRLIRPAQDSSGGLYGRALSLQEVTRLDSGGFQESERAMIQPNPKAGVVGIHSIAWDQELIVVDLCRRIPRIPVLRRFSRSLGAPLVRSVSPDELRGRA